MPDPANPTDPAPAPAPPVPPAEDPQIRAALEHKAKLADNYEARLRQIRDTDAQAYAYITARLVGDPAELPAPAAARATAATEVVEDEIDPGIKKYVEREIESRVSAQVQAIRAQLTPLQNRAAVDDVGKQLDRLKAEVLATGGTEEDFAKLGAEIERQLTETPALSKAPNAILTIGLAADRARLKSRPATPAGPSPEIQALRARIRGLPGRVTAINTPAPADTRTKSIDEIMDRALAKAQAEA